MDHYAILGIRRKAAKDEIRAAYRREVMKWHPDRQPGNSQAAEHFRRLKEAFSVLSDDRKRTAYDDRLLEPRRIAAVILITSLLAILAFALAPTVDPVTQLYQGPLVPDQQYSLVAGTAAAEFAAAKGLLLYALGWPGSSGRAGHPDLGPLDPAAALGLRAAVLAESFRHLARGVASPGGVALVLGGLHGLGLGLWVYLCLRLGRGLMARSPSLVMGLVLGPLGAATLWLIKAADRHRAQGKKKAK